MPTVEGTGVLARVIDPDSAVPAHRRVFGTRSSPLTGSSRTASNPVNALLNYLYAILETEVRLAVLVKIAPVHDILPVQARHDGGQAWQIGLNVIAGGEDRWYTLADCVASTLLTGTPPEVVEAVRLVPHGQQDGLQPVRLHGEVAVDPTSEDFFRQVIELRKSLPADVPEEERERLGGFLKVLANSTSYGIFAEMTRQDSTKQTTEVAVYGIDAEPFTCRVTGPEEPGKYCFPPLAALIAGGRG